MQNPQIGPTMYGLTSNLKTTTKFHACKIFNNQKIKLAFFYPLSNFTFIIPKGGNYKKNIWSTSIITHILYIIFFFLLLYDNYIVLIVSLNVISFKIAYLVIMSLHSSYICIWFSTISPLVVCLFQIL